MDQWTDAYLIDRMDRYSACMRLWTYHCPFPPSSSTHRQTCHLFHPSINHTTQVHHPDSPTYQTHKGEADHRWWDMKHREDSLALLTALLLLRAFKVGRGGVWMCVCEYVQPARLTSVHPTTIFSSFTAIHSRIFLRRTHAPYSSRCSTCTAASPPPAPAASTSGPAASGASCVGRAGGHTTPPTQSLACTDKHAIFDTHDRKRHGRSWINGGCFPLYSYTVLLAPHWIVSYCLAVVAVMLWWVGRPIGAVWLCTPSTYPCCVAVYCSQAHTYTQICIHTPTPLICIQVEVPLLPQGLQGHRHPRPNGHADGGGGPLVPAHARHHQCVVGGFSVGCLVAARVFFLACVSTVISRTWHALSKPSCGHTFDLS